MLCGAMVSSSWYCECSFVAGLFSCYVYHDLVVWRAVSTSFWYFLSRVLCLLSSPCDIAAPSIWCCLCTCVAGCSVSFWCCVSAWLYLIALLRFLQWFGLSPHQLARFALLSFAFMVDSGTVILFVSTSLSVFVFVCSCRFHVAHSLACF